VPSPSTQYGVNPRVDFIWHEERVADVVHRSRLVATQVRQALAR
jgi:hypothetical protein